MFTDSVVVAGPVLRALRTGDEAELRGRPDVRLPWDIAQVAIPFAAADPGEVRRLPHTPPLEPADPGLSHDHLRMPKFLGSGAAGCARRVRSTRKACLPDPRSWPSQPRRVQPEPASTPHSPRALSPPKAWIEESLA